MTAERDFRMTDDHKAEALDLDALESTARAAMAGPRSLAFARFLFHIEPAEVLALIAALKEAQARIDRASDWLAENRPIRCSYASPDDHDDAETLIQILYRSEAP